MAIIPIWKTTYFSTTGTTALEFAVFNGEYEIFHGYAQPAPSTGLINIKLNDICGSYLNSKLPVDKLSVTGDTVALQEGYADFTLKFYNTALNDWTVGYEWAFVNDTSYVEREGTGCYSDPINGHVAQGQILPYSYLTQLSAETICYEIN